MARVAAVTAERQTLHLDWLDYAVALLAGGGLNWADAQSVATLYGKAQALLPSDLIVVPFERIVTAHVAAHPALAAAMAAKPHGAEPLRALLRDVGLRAMVADVMVRVGRATTPALLAISVADPASLARWAAALADVAQPEPDEDLADDAAAYLADALRGFADTPLAAVVIADAQPRFREFLAPVRKVAAHYGWDVGIAGGADPAFNFALDPHPPGDIMSPAPISSVVIPADMLPEVALATVVALRKAMS